MTSSDSALRLDGVVAVFDLECTSWEGAQARNWSGPGGEPEVVDIGAMSLPFMFQSYLLCALVAAMASSTKFIDTYIVGLLVAMNPDIILQHAFLEAVPAVLFGTAGGLFVPPVIRRLKSHGVI